MCIYDYKQNIRGQIPQKNNGARLSVRLDQLDHVKATNSGRATQHNNIDPTQKWDWLKLY